MTPTLSARVARAVEFDELAVRFKLLEMLPYGLSMLNPDDIGNQCLRLAEAASRKEHARLSPLLRVLPKLVEALEVLNENWNKYYAEASDAARLIPAIVERREQHKQAEQVIAAIEAALREVET
jgi:hypothetical protein